MNMWILTSWTTQLYAVTDDQLTSLTRLSNKDILWESNRSLWLHKLRVRWKFGGLKSFNTVLGPHFHGETRIPKCISIRNPLKNMGCTDPQLPLIWKPDSQIPQCTCPVCYNTPIWSDMHIFLFWMVYSKERHTAHSIVSWPRYGTGAWWDLRNWSIYWFFTLILWVLCEKCIVFKSIKVYLVLVRKLYSKINASHVFQYSTSPLFELPSSDRSCHLPAWDSSYIYTQITQAVLWIRGRPVDKCNPLLGRVIQYDLGSRLMGNPALTKWEHDNTENMQIMC